MWCCSFFCSADVGGRAARKEAIHSIILFHAYLTNHSTETHLLVLETKLVGAVCTGQQLHRDQRGAPRKADGSAGAVSREGSMHALDVLKGAGAGHPVGPNSVGLVGHHYNCRTIVVIVEQLL